MIAVNSTVVARFKIEWIKPKANPRKGWENAFKKMHESGYDKALMNDVFEEENFEEWI
jgi:antitoxin MazE